MTRSLGRQLTDALRQTLDGSAVHDRHDANPTFLLVTTDSDGWPHVAMLSVGEILAVDATRLRAGLWLHSTTTRNLEHDGRALLAAVALGNAYYVRLTARRGADLDLGTEGRLAYFALQVDDVLEDAADYAALTSGVTFRLMQPAQVVARWQRTVDALRAAA